MKKSYPFYVHSAQFFLIRTMSTKKYLQIIFLFCFSLLLQRELVAQTQYYITTDTVVAGKRVFGSLNSLMMWSTSVNYVGNGPTAQYIQAGQYYNINITDAAFTEQGYVYPQGQINIASNFT